MEEQSEADAWVELEFLRWDPKGPEACPHCKVAGRCFFLKPANGSTRHTRTGSESARRVWKCGACRRQFTALTGTGLERSKLPIAVWLNILMMWIEKSDAGTKPTVQDIQALYPPLRSNDAFRAWYRVAHAVDGDFLALYRDW